MRKRMWFFIASCFLLMLVVALAAMTSSTRASPGEVCFHVKSTETGLPIPGALVMICDYWTPNAVWGSKTTDALGDADFLNVPEEPPGPMFRYGVYKLGWEFIDPHDDAHVFGVGHGRLDIDVHMSRNVGGVGGVMMPTDKFGLLAPYFGLASTIMVATVAAAIYVKRVKTRKEK